MYIIFKVCLEYPQNIEEIKRSNDKKKHINLTNGKNPHSYEQKKTGTLHEHQFLLKNMLIRIGLKIAIDMANRIACVQ